MQNHSVSQRIREHAWFCKTNSSKTKSCLICNVWRPRRRSVKGRRKRAGHKGLCRCTACCSFMHPLALRPQRPCRSLPPGARSLLLTSTGPTVLLLLTAASRESNSIRSSAAFCETKAMKSHLADLPKSNNVWNWLQEGKGAQSLALTNRETAGLTELLG